MELHAIAIDNHDSDAAQSHLDTNIHVMDYVPHEIRRSINRVLEETANSSKILPEDILEPYFLNDISGDMASVFVNSMESPCTTDIGHSQLEEGTSSRKGGYGQSIPTTDSLLGKLLLLEGDAIDYFQPTVPAACTQGKGLLLSLPLGGAGGFLKFL